MSVTDRLVKNLDEFISENTKHAQVAFSFNHTVLNGTIMTFPYSRAVSTGFNQGFFESDVEKVKKSPLKKVKKQVKKVKNTKKERNKKEKIKNIYKKEGGRKLEIVQKIC